MYSANFMDLGGFNRFFMGLGGRGSPHQSHYQAVGKGRQKQARDRRREYPKQKIF